ncbi:MAG: hypothetical protein AB7S38_02055 [Vulcanimicrobiota bacterium]
MSRPGGPIAGLFDLLARAEQFWSSQRELVWRHFSVAGEHLRVGSPDSELLERLTWALGPAEPGPSGLEVRLWSGSPELVLEESWRQARGDCPDFGPGRLTQCGPEAPVCLWQESLAYYWVPGRLSDHELGAPLRTAIYLWLARQQRQLVHAAAVSRDGRAVLIGGRGGSGKSFLCRHLEGWSCLGDDYVGLGPGAVYPVYRSLKLDGQLERLEPAAPATLVGGLLLGADEGPAPVSRLARTIGASTLLLLPWSDAGDLARIGSALNGLPCWGLPVRPSVKVVHRWLARFFDACGPANV